MRADWGDDQRADYCHVAGLGRGTLNAAPAESAALARRADLHPALDGVDAVKTHPLIEQHRRAGDWCLLHKTTPCLCLPQSRMSEADIRLVMAEWVRDWSATKTLQRVSRERKPWATLRVADVWEIRRRLAARETRHQIAVSLGVAWHTIDNIQRGRTWNHLAAADPPPQGAYKPGADWRHDRNVEQR